MIVCVLIPRFELAVAAGGREALAAGPVALAPEAGSEQRIGQSSAAAEAFGVHAGLRLGEALARCPGLRLVAPDPVGVADEWDRLLGALEGIGAAVEPGPPGSAWFDARGLETLHGGLEGVIKSTRRALATPTRDTTAPRTLASSRGAGATGRASASSRGDGATGRASASSRGDGATGRAPASSRGDGATGRAPASSRGDGATGRASFSSRGVVDGSSGGRALGAPARIGAAPSRFAALAAATKARARRAEVAPGGPARLAAYLAPLPVSLLAMREETAVLPEALERFGIRTLGELARLPRDSLADRFGAAGPLARDLARGRDSPLRPRRVAERLEERLDLPESASGPQLQRALGLLVDRLLARRERRSRTLRRVVLSAELVEGGTWRSAVTFREALADPRRMRLVLVPRLDELPAPATALRLQAEGFGPPAGDQRSLLSEPAAVRAARLREAVRQARSVAGPEAALRILPVDPGSRVPERRLALTPWEP